MKNNIDIEKIKKEVAEYFRKCLAGEIEETWPKELVWEDENFPFKKARIHKDGRVEVQPRVPLNYISMTLKLEK